MANNSNNRKYHFIYKTTCSINKKYYIGMHSTNNLKDNYLGSGKYLRYSIKKYGKENFKIEILELLNTREELVKRETEIVSLNEIAKKECMNLRIGGSGGFTKEEQTKGCQASGLKHAKRLLSDKEYRDKCCKAISSGVKQGYSNGTRIKRLRSDTFKGRTHTTATRLKQSIIRQGTGLGERNSQYGTCWVTKEGINKKIKKEELTNFTQQGWILGRKLK